MELAALVVYPVKSCAGIDVSSWDRDERGLRGDRSHMVVAAATGASLTQRELPALALVRPELCDGSLRVSTPTGRVIAQRWGRRAHGQRLGAHGSCP